MKAARVHGTNGAASVFYEDAPEPRPRPGEVLVRVHAAAVTPQELEWVPTTKTASGAPRRRAILGHELSGIIVAIGEGVHDLVNGEAVYGIEDRWFEDGAQAELVAVRSESVAIKPHSIDHAAASVVPISGLTAWQALVDRGGLVSGQRVLIHGGAGGVGSIAIQIAKERGADVIATASARDALFVSELGADVVIDYRSQKFETLVCDVDIVLDTVGGETLERSKRVLKPHGTLVSVANDSTATPYFFYVAASRPQLTELARLIDRGKIRPLVDSVLPLSRAREAYEPRSRRGKVVISVVP